MAGSRCRADRWIKMPASAKCALSHSPRRSRRNELVRPRSSHVTPSLVGGLAAAGCWPPMRRWRPARNWLIAARRCTGGRRQRQRQVVRSDAVDTGHKARPAPKCSGWSTSEDAARFPGPSGSGELAVDAAMAARGRGARPCCTIGARAAAWCRFALPFLVAEAARPPGRVSRRQARVSRRAAGQSRRATRLAGERARSVRSQAADDRRPAQPAGAGPDRKSDHGPRRRIPVEAGIRRPASSSAANRCRRWSRRSNSSRPCAAN